MPNSLPLDLKTLTSLSDSPDNSVSPLVLSRIENIQDALETLLEEIRMIPKRSLPLRTSNSHSQYQPLITDTSEPRAPPPNATGPSTGSTRNRRRRQRRKRSNKPKHLIKRLNQLLPNIQPIVILDATRHTLQPKDLYKLDTNFVTYTVCEDLVKSGKSPYPWHMRSSFFTALSNYFQVLFVCASESQLQSLSHSKENEEEEDIANLIANGSMKYMAKIAMLSHQFQWVVVYRFHLEFFRRRLLEMRRGDFSGWSLEEKELQEKYLKYQDRLFKSHLIGCKGKNPSSSS
ncbi:hypothetical protein C8Q75DRAFT_3603 [Abortiporus biennis]|nr:hypothetical protein C8Q75DRAFT_3603 [Abortiporus biennis]